MTVGRISSRNNCAKLKNSELRLDFQFARTGLSRTFTPLSCPYPFDGSLNTQQLLPDVVKFIENFFDWLRRSCLQAWHVVPLRSLISSVAQETGAPWQGGRVCKDNNSLYEPKTSTKRSRNSLIRSSLPNKFFKFWHDNVSICSLKRIRCKLSDSRNLLVAKNQAAVSQWRRYNPPHVSA